jgi:hypothetical protein
MITVKQGDTHDITFTVTDADGGGVNLTGATVRLLARPQADATPVVLACSISNAVAGEVTHTLTGTLLPVRYYVELEITKSGKISTAPTDGYETLRVVKQIN